MARKSAHRRAKPARHARNDGVIARIADRAIDNPAMSGGLLVMALTASAIVSNAMFLQAGRHPEPIFATRQATVPRPVPAPQPVAVAPEEVPLPRSRAEPSAAALAAPAAPQPLAEVTASPAVDQTLIADVQRELARRGFYVGAIDGIAGPQTSTAVSAFEASVGLPVTGEATETLLAALTKPEPPAAASAEPSTPAETTAVEAASAEQAVESLSVSDGADDLATAESEKADAEEQARYFRVQAALNLIGYGPVTVDGQAGEQTADAIRRFELDNGLPITGTVDDALIERLVAIGAMQSM